MVKIRADFTERLTPEFNALVQAISSPAYDAEIVAEVFYFEPTSNFDTLDVALIEQLCAGGIRAASESPFPIRKELLIARGIFEESSFETIVGKISYFFAVIASETDFSIEIDSRQHKGRFDEFLATLNKHFKLTSELRYIEYFPYRDSFGSFGVAWGLWAIIIDTTSNRGLMLYLNAFL